KQTSTDDLAAARELREKCRQFAEVFPDRRAALDEGFRAWLARASTARYTEVVEVPASNMTEFKRTAAARRALVEAFPETHESLATGEARWAEKSANYTVVALTHADLTPAEIRAGCREAAEELVALEGFDTSPQRFRDARVALFRAAQDAAGAEIRKHIEA